MEEKQLKVVYTNHGFANFFGDHIEINKKLKNNKRLRDYVIKHELGHKEEFDLWHEFKIDWKVMPLLLLFIFSTPSAWIDFLPIQIRKRRIILDINLLILWFFCAALIFLFVYLFL
jgi:hypothetical protein